jgi:glutamate racemase
MKQYKIGVFDSGMGGLSVANAIEKALPDNKVVFRNDSEHVPYGNRTPEEILKLVTPIFNELIDDGCDVIVVACNTVTTTSISTLRTSFDIPLVGIEPMVKPAAEETKSKVIAVCATPTTLKSKRYRELKETYAKGVTVLEPNCEDWAYMIEHNEIDDEKISSRIGEILDRKADVIVLACTHYHWIEDKIVKMAKGRAEVIQPEEAIIRQLKRVLET